MPQPEPPPAVEPPSVPEVRAPAPAPAPAPAGTTLEELLGTRWAVWAGGLSLALGGLLLVRFSIEQGIFGPGVRVALGALFSLALIAAGEWFRRTERGLPVEAIPAAHVPSILTAAGTVSAFGTVYAAHALYDFIGPAAAFVLLGIIGVATMLAAALHGPALAGLGLAGSLVVPMLVSSQTPSPWPLVIYLAVVAAAAYALARLRRWLWLAAAVVVGVFFWGLALMGQIGSGMRRRLGVGAVRPRGPATGARGGVHRARAASRHARRATQRPTGSRRPRWRPCRCSRCWPWASAASTRSGPCSPSSPWRSWRSPPGAARPLPRRRRWPASSRSAPSPPGRA